MFLRCQSQWERFSRVLTPDLLSDFLTDRAVQLASSPLPGQFLLEGKGTPGTPRFDLLRSQPQQQQVCHHRHGHRALHPGRVFRHLVLAQAHHALEFLDTEFDRPSSQIEGYGQVCG